jgi:hypothetical protein
MKEGMVLMRSVSEAVDLSARDSVQVMGADLRDYLATLQERES